MTQTDYEAFLSRVRERRKEGPYVVDHGGGFGGSTVVTGPTLRAGFIPMSSEDKRAEELANDLNGAWAAGYEEAHAAIREKDAEAERLRKRLNAVMPQEGDVMGGPW